MIMDQLQNFAVICSGFFGTFLDGKRPWIKRKESQAEIYRIERNGGDVRDDKRNLDKGKGWFRV
jgi:hypothetical protein